MNEQASCLNFFCKESYMFGFRYFTPTKVVFGKNSEEKVAELVQEFGGKKVLIHYGGGSVYVAEDGECG